MKAGDDSYAAYREQARRDAIEARIRREEMRKQMPWHERWATALLGVFFAAMLLGGFLLGVHTR
jgi:hypothetical protein